MMLAQNNYFRTHQLPLYHQNQQQQQHHSRHLNIDDHSSLDTIDSDASIASSPHSTLSQYSGFQTTPLSATFSDHAAASRRPEHNKSRSSGIDNNNSRNFGQVPDLMPSEPWMLQNQQQQQTPRAAHRLGHHRESSLSSLNSNGPASPYNATTSNPQIAITDSNSDGFADLAGGDCNYSYQLGKPMSNDNFYASLQGLNSRGAVATDMSFADGLSQLSAQQQQRMACDRSLLPAADLSIGQATRSRPVSVASSTIGADSPATPSYQEVEEDNRRRKNVFNNTLPPKLDRTMTDVYSDELYSPHFTITSASPPPQTHVAMSPSNHDLFTQALKAANSQHLSAAQSPVSSSSRTHSPFRHGSPLAPSSNDFSQGQQIRLNTAQQLREKQKQERDAKALRQQIARNTSPQQQAQGTPNTISPKDAMLDFNETEGTNFPLFPSQEPNEYDMSQPTKAVPQSSPNFQAPTPLQNAFNFTMPTSIQIPQQYPFVARPQQEPRATPSSSTFSRVSSEDTTASTGSDASIQRPARTNADGGTYTCTYHGCTLRFETPALLQKHKREGHRQAHALAAPRHPSPSVPESLLGSQAGPHRCDRINPSTGKPCSTIFSRPYDLTRHEDTIHNARKKKVRCHMCTEEKTFSRADALTRHFRVCHPDVEFPGKHRRRGGSTV